jgi:hypothetical protein
VQDHLHLGEVVLRLKRIQNPVDFAPEEGGSPGVLFQVCIHLQHRLTDGLMGAVMEHGQCRRRFQGAGVDFIAFDRAADRESSFDHEAILHRPAVKDHHGIAGIIGDGISTDEAQALKERRDSVTRLDAGFQAGDLNGIQFCVQDGIGVHRLVSL